MDDKDLESAAEAMDNLDTPHERNYSNYPPPAKKPRRTWRIILIIMCLLLVGIGGFAAWALWFAPKAASPSVPARITAPKTVQDTQKTLTDTPKSSSTKDYTAANLGLKFAYASDWTVSDTADKGIRIQSPNFTYKTAAEQSVKGYFRISMRKTARDVDSKYIGQGLAIKPSEELVYSKPSEGQVSKTLLSSFGINTTDSFSFFMIASGFNLQKGETLGDTYGKEAGTYIITGGYSSDDMPDDIQMNSVTLNYYMTTNAYKQALDIIKSLQL